MQLIDFILSDKFKYRISRHLLFWTVFGTGFYLQSIVPTSDIYLSAFRSLCFFLPVCILTVYFNLYVLLPRLLWPQKFLRFIVAFLLAAVGIYILNYFAALLFTSISCNCPASTIPSSQKLAFAFINTVHAETIGIIALGIKFSKNWYCRQLETLGLARQKIVTELQFQKASIYPKFLFQSLEALFVKITTQSSGSPALLLRLSDLLSYIIYESRNESVSLTTELQMIKNRILIEKIIRGGNLNLRMQISGDSDSRNIIPLALFSFFDNLIKFTGSISKNVTIDLRIAIAGTNLSLAVDLKSPGQPDFDCVNWEALLDHSKRQLERLYSDRFDLKITKEQRVTRIYLDLVIDHSFTNENVSHTNATAT